jgi:hypothetical protein
MHEDQAVRLENFAADHPDITVLKPDYGNGALVWSAHRDGLVLCAEPDLKVLLDRLDWLLSAAGSAA